MAKKRVKKSSKKATKKSSGKPKSMNSRKRIDMVARRLVFFLVLFVLFIIFDAAVSNELWSDFFRLGAWIFGFVSASLFVVLLVLWFLKMMKKKK